MAREGNRMTSRTERERIELVVQKAMRVRGYWLTIDVANLLRRELAKRDARVRKTVQRRMRMYEEMKPMRSTQQSYRKGCIDGLDNLLLDLSALRGKGAR